VDVRAQAEQYAARLAAEGEDYADRTLASLAATLQRSAATAEQGRAALASRRRSGAPADAEQADRADDPALDQLTA
jgi:hypothetical protein